MSDPLFFNSLSDLGRVLIAAPILYAAIILFIRLSGKRSTSQMNNFDWIVTVALGSIMASGLLLEDVTIMESVTAIGSLIALQALLTKLVFHQAWAGRLVKARPALLFAEGEFIDEALRAERVTRDEVLAAVRESSLGAIKKVQWVILETDATMSVIAKDGVSHDTDVLEGVPRHGPTS